MQQHATVTALGQSKFHGHRDSRQADETQLRATALSASTNEFRRCIFIPWTLSGVFCVYVFVRVIYRNMRSQSKASSRKCSRTRWDYRPILILL